MQNTKDTFYQALRTRLTALNHGRTLVLRGVMRPGVLVEENELVSAIDAADCFRLAWTQPSVDAEGALPTVTLQCEIRYETAGTAFNGGMDRGRALSAMDAELLAAIDAQPRNAVKTNYTNVSTDGAAAMSTNVWWSNVVFGNTTVRGDRLARTANVAVFSYQEAGEL